MALTATACPACQGDGEPALLARDRNRGIGDELFEYRRCGTCRTLFLANAPDDIGRWYPASYYALGDAEAHSDTEQAKLALLQPFASEGRLVEVGPGSGGFAAAAARSGFDVVGIEMDERACRHLREVIGVDCVHSEQPDRVLAGMAPSRAIVLWHVLEHLPDPVALLGAAAANLGDGGALLVAVPNPEAMGLRVLGSRWPHLDAPRHRALIPAAKLAELARSAGLEQVAVTASDRTGRDWNVFAWEHVFLRPDSGPSRRRAAFYTGALIALAVAPIERRGLRGSTYTAVFRKAPAS